MGGISDHSVRALIRSGRLQAKRQVVRGRGGKDRYIVLESHINAYLDGLPDATPAPESAPNAGKAGKPKKARLPKTDGGTHTFHRFV